MQADEIHEPPEAMAGPPRFVWFDGILAGPREASDAFERELSDLRRRVPVETSLEVDAGRFSLLLSDHPLPGDRIVGDCREGFAAEVGKLVRLATNPGALESTLRCTEVFDARVRESLFSVRGGELVCVSRTRDLRPADLERIPGTRAEPPAARPWGRIALLASLLLVVFVGTAWQSGWIDRAFAAASAKIQVELGPFDTWLSVQLKDSWGDYDVIVRRGPGYPTSKDEADRLRANAKTPVEQAATAALLDGNTVYVRTESSTSEALDVREISLRALIARADGEISARLPGRIAARKLVIALDPGRVGK